MYASTSTNNATATASSGGTSILGLLGVAFIVLKLTGVIDWPWWLVTLPLWGVLALVAVILVVVLVGWLLTRLTKRVRGGHR